MLLHRETLPAARTPVSGPPGRRPGRPGRAAEKRKAAPRGPAGVPGRPTHAPEPAPPAAAPHSPAWGPRGPAEDGAARKHRLPPRTHLPAPPRGRRGSRRAVAASFPNRGAGVAAAAEHFRVRQHLRGESAPARPAERRARCCPLPAARRPRGCPGADAPSEPGEKRAPDGRAGCDSGRGPGCPGRILRAPATRQALSWGVPASANGLRASPGGARRRRWGLRLRRDRKRRHSAARAPAAGGTPPAARLQGQGPAGKAVPETNAHRPGLRGAVLRPPLSGRGGGAAAGKSEAGGRLQGGPSGREG